MARSIYKEQSCPINIVYLCSYWPKMPKCCSRFCHFGAPWWGSRWGCSGPWTARRRTSRWGRWPRRRRWGARTGGSLLVGGHRECRRRRSSSPASGSSSGRTARPFAGRWQRSQPHTIERPTCDRDYKTFLPSLLLLILLQLILLMMIT